jgi:DNA (cytosine-5)-methyltransferase 1
VGNTESPRLTPCAERQGQRKSWGASIGSSQWWETEPNVDRVVDGLASRVDRLKAIGNGQVPLCAATAWRILK